MAQLEHIESIEKRLWKAADTLRSNSNYASNEYFMPVMGLIFLRHAFSRYLAVRDGIEAGLPTRGGKKRALTKEDISQKGAIFFRPEAQFDYLVGLKDGDHHAKAIMTAMESIEADYQGLRGVLPKDEYQELDNDVLGQLLRTLNPDELKRASGDVFGRIIVDEAIVPEADSSYEKGDPYDISRIDFDRLHREFACQKAKRTTVQNLRQVVEKRLSQLLAQNPLRTNFQEEYDRIVTAYNLEKDRATIEATFEALLKVWESLDTEAKRAMREGLDEETLAIFDLLKKPDLKPKDIKRIKEVAVELLQILKVRKLKIDHWRDKESTRDAVRVAIKDFLWSDGTGLPVGIYDENEVSEKIENVYLHVFRAYPRLPSPYFSGMGA